MAMANVQRPRLREIRSRSGDSPVSQPVLLRTCQNCFHAKIRCDRSNATGACDRCKRLNKECYFPPARRRYNGAKRDARIEALEAKLEQLLTGSGSVSSTDEIGGLEQNSTMPVNMITAQPTAVQSPEMSHTRSSSVAQLSNYESIESIEVHPDCISLGYLSIDIAESLLHRFKTEMTPHFPFVVVPGQMSAESLRHLKPFLLLSILVAASYDNIHLQRTLDKQMKHMISSNMVFGEFASIDLLQGLLVHLAWTQYRSKPRCYYRYLHLAISVITDLRLDKPPDSRPSKMRIDLIGEQAGNKTSFDLDEQRAVLGCYYLSSTVSTILQKFQAFPYSKHVEDCARNVSHNQHYSTDKYLYYIVHLQRMMERIDDLSSIRGMNFEHQQFSNPGQTQYPTFDGQVKQVKAELDELKLQLPFDMRESSLLMTQFHTVELYLCEISLIGSDPTVANRLQDESHLSPWGLEILGIGLVSAKSLFTFYLSLPYQTEMNFNNSEWIQLGFMLTFAARLAVMAAEKNLEQSTIHLRQFLAMSDILKDVLVRMRYLLTTRMDVHDGGESDAIFQFEQRIARLQHWFESQSHSQSQGLATTAATPTTPPQHNQQPTPYNQYSADGGPVQPTAMPARDPHHHSLQSVLEDNFLTTEFDFHDNNLLWDELENRSLGDFVFS